MSGERQERQRPAAPAHAPGGATAAERQPSEAAPAQSVVAAPGGPPAHQTARRWRQAAIAQRQRILGNSAVQRQAAARPAPLMRQDRGDDAVATEEPVADREAARRLFDEASAYFTRGDYRRAIIRFERLRQTPGLEDAIVRDVLYNIGVCNLRLERFATAIIYLEQYLTLPGAVEADGAARLAEARRGAGVAEPEAGGGATPAPGSSAPPTPGSATAPAAGRGAGRDSAERDWEAANSAGGAELRDERTLVLWNFAVGSAALKPEHRAALRSFLDANGLLFLDGSTRLVIDGHASSSGSDTLNSGLSSSRAAGVAAWFVAQGRFGAERIDQRGHGEAQPLLPNTSPESMARNRRVEITINAPGARPPRGTDEPAPGPEPATPTPEPEPTPEPGGPSPTAEESRPTASTRFRIRMLSGGEGGEGVGGGVYTFEIEALDGPRGSAMYTFAGGGLTGGAPAGGYGPSDWSDFTTTVPRTLSDFEGFGRIAAAGLFAGDGYGYSRLVFYCNDGETQVVEGVGYGTGVAGGASWFHGWWEMRD